MNLRRLTITALLVMLSTAPAAAAQDVAQETETQRDARLAWWREARFGMFIHWGAYAVPAGTHKGERIAGIGEWIMSRAHIPIPEYEDYVHRFNPTRFDPDEWVRIAADAGMKYMIITSSAVLATAIGGVGEGGGVGGRSGLSSLPEPQQRLADRVAGHPIPAQRAAAPHVGQSSSRPSRRLLPIAPRGVGVMRKPRTLSFRKTCARPCCQVQLRPAGEVRRRGGASFGKGLVVRAPHLWYARITRSTVQENVRPRLHRCANHLASDDIG